MTYEGLALFGLWVIVWCYIPAVVALMVMKTADFDE